MKKILTEKQIKTELCQKSRLWKKKISMILRREMLLSIVFHEKKHYFL